MEIGKLIRKARRDLEWSQAELAKRAGVSVPTVVRTEAGIEPRLSTVLALLGVLGLRLDVKPNET